MKSFIVVLVVCFAIGLSECFSKEKREEMFLKLANECAEKEGATEEEVNELLQDKPASAKGGKCVRACLAETIGMMKNNRVDIEGTVSVAAMAFDGDATKVQVARDLANDCANITDADRCEAAEKICACGREAAKSRGLKFKDM